MSKIDVCDICGNDLHVENQHAEFKIPKAFWLSPSFDGFTAYRDKSKLDICFKCWHKFKDFVRNSNLAKPAPQDNGKET